MSQTRFYEIPLKILQEHPLLWVQRNQDNQPNATFCGAPGIRAQRPCRLINPSQVTALANTVQSVGSAATCHECCSSS